MANSVVKDFPSTCLLSIAEERLQRGRLMERMKPSPCSIRITPSVAVSTMARSS